MKKILLLSVCLFFITGLIQATTYYSQVTGSQDMSTLSNWNTNTGGGGSNPSNFTTSGDLFIVQSTHSITLTAAFTLGSGVNFEIQGAFDPNSSNLSIGGTTAVTGTGSFSDGSATGTNTFSGNISNNSTNNFSCTSASLSPSGSNLDISGSGSFSFSGTVSIASGKTVTNLCSNANGVSMTGILNGGNSTSEWINGTNTLLNYGPTSVVDRPMFTGKLTSTASSSFVNYNRADDQDVKGGTFANIRISSGGIKTLKGILEITETLDLVNGILKSRGSFYTFLKNGSTTNIGNNNSYIQGPMRYEMAYNGTRTLILPTGKDPDWRPMELTITHSTSTSYTYVCNSVNASAASLGYTLPGTVSAVSESRYWKLYRVLSSNTLLNTNADISGNPVIKLYYGTNDLVSDAANLTICQNQTSSLSTWSDIGGTGATNGIGSISSTSSPEVFNGFDVFTLGNKTGGSNALPIKLVSFTGSCGTDNTILEWTTASEINNDFFTIESSQDGNNWTIQKTVKGAGNSLHLIHYKTEIPGVIFESTFFRLKQTDYDGSFEYSDPIHVKNCAVNTDKVTIFPNPSNGSIDVHYSGPEMNIKSIEVYSVLGNLVYQHDGFENKINLSNLPAGLYYTHFNGLNEKFIEKIMIK